MGGGKGGQGHWARGPFPHATSSFVATLNSARTCLQLASCIFSTCRSMTLIGGSPCISIVNFVEEIYCIILLALERPTCSFLLN